MSREIRPIPSSTSGNDIMVPFPDLAKPEEGGWELNVTLHDDSGGGRAKITLLQSIPDGEDKDLGTTTVMLTGTPAVYNVPLTGDSLEESAVGRCNLSHLFLRIEGQSFLCCWFEDQIPDSLTLSDGTDSIVMTRSGDDVVWLGTGDIAGCINRSVALACIGGGTGPGDFYFTVNSAGQGSPPLFCSPTGTCTPTVDLSCTLIGCDEVTSYDLTITE